MTRMEQLTCKNCGAPLTPSGKCEYCGTVYRIEHPPSHVNIVEVQQSPVVTLGATVRLDAHTVKHIGEDAASKMAVDHLSGKIADSLAEYLMLDTSYDPHNDAVIVHGKVRIVPPDYRF